jgi:leader peptidase (prepilin peptidase)/N-methyltransferase
MFEVAIFIIGSVIGSFLNVCIYRMPKGESIIFPSSHCPECKHSLAWWENVPILDGTGSSDKNNAGFNQISLKNSLRLKMLCLK